MATSVETALTIQSLLRYTRSSLTLYWVNLGVWYSPCFFLWYNKSVHILWF